MYNRVTFAGYITHTPDFRLLTKGTEVVPVITLRLAVKSANEEVLFIYIVAFGKQAESCHKCLDKGNPVLVEGRLKESIWEYEGQRKSKVQCIASKVVFLPRNSVKPEYEMEKVSWNDVIGEPF
ncbi:single-stranded DNA-binding protein [Candidatus Magnetobacterium casense]|uniref:Single-stranded DNA-binding protein n=1 Tax=Candidatus Magnetobacterium casense TaxID=1455061 RepID=A0ABS6S1Y5_9BACT|nr:single-stranded DNA-binding protein [Candidatus Magnetobacterium casensis]MBV6342867.1 single-stranded DNA-binding protein [Candidatus Magnetobacterium casensis]